MAESFHYFPDDGGATVSLLFDVSGIIGDESSIVPNQQLARTISGRPRVAELGLSRTQLSFTAIVSESGLANLLSFFGPDNVNLMANSFAYTDHLGVLHPVRLVQPPSRVYIGPARIRVSMVLEELIQ